MSVSVANLPLSVSDDNINLGEMDSVRRRALWVLEGKPDLNTFPKLKSPTLVLRSFLQRSLNFVRASVQLKIRRCY